MCASVRLAIVGTARGIVFVQIRTNTIPCQPDCRWNFPTKSDFRQYTMEIADTHHCDAWAACRDFNLAQCCEYRLKIAPHQIRTVIV